MSVIKTPPHDLIASIRQVDAVEIVAFGSKPSEVNKIMAFLPKDFSFGNYSVEDAAPSKPQTLPDNSGKKGGVLEV